MATESVNMAAAPSSIPLLLEAYNRGDRQALARLISLLARGEQVEAISSSLEGGSFNPSPPKAAPVVAVTGSGGVGKSTLIGRIIEYLRVQNQTVAVLACDPQSALTGGALLGDRIRMAARTHDSGVFIRSLAAASGEQAIAANLNLIVSLLVRYGFDVVLVETVGAGQGDTAVRDVVDVVTLLVQPEAGDDLQWEKAGVLEIADIVVVNKSDLPGAERVQSQLRDILHLAGSRTVPVILVSGGKNEGVDQLWTAISVALDQRPERPATAG